MRITTILLTLAGCFAALPAADAYEVLRGPTELIHWDRDRAFEGYTLFGCGGTTYLLDMQGGVVHTWRAGTNPRLLENGHLLDASRDDPSGFQGFVELDWDGKVVWEYREKRPGYAPHHDFVRIHNKQLGAPTTLYIANKAVSETEAAAAGFDVRRGLSRGASVDTIVEVDMDGNVVWEWRFIDHLVQDEDPAAGNYAGRGKSVRDVPGRLDARLPGRRLRRDWLHCNSLDYNAELDQIVVNSVQGEFYVIDHGGTFVAGDPKASVAKAAGPAGDFLYRFGDPARYGQGDPPAILEDWTQSTSGHKQIGGSHDVQWIKPGLPGAGHFLIFNNGQYLFERTPQSSILEIDGFRNARGRSGDTYVNPPEAAYHLERADKDTHKSPREVSNQIVWSYRSRSNQSFFSHIGSGCQRLPNGNTLICSDTEGHLFEVTADGDVVWEYVNPVTKTWGTVKEMPDALPMTNSVFRTYRYAADHPALKGRVLTLKGTITDSFPREPRPDRSERRGRRDDRDRDDGERRGGRRGGGRRRERQDDRPRPRGAADEGGQRGEDGTPVNERARRRARTGAKVPEYMVAIPAGRFRMGDHHDLGGEQHPTDELPIHTVELDAFHIGHTPVTNAQYAAFLNEAAERDMIEVHRGRVMLKGAGALLFETSAADAASGVAYEGRRFAVRPGRANHPVVCVRWLGAAAYCNALGTRLGYEACYDLKRGLCDFSKRGFRLPTEAEWEYAGRGGERGGYHIFPWGDEPDSRRANWPRSGDPYETGPYPWTTPVGFYDGSLRRKKDFDWPGRQETYQTADSRNVFGLFDMCGNVWEWLNDWYGRGYYADSPGKNPTGPGIGSRMPDGKRYHGMRGGNWYNGKWGHSRVSNRDPAYYRGPDDPHHRWYHVGFRVVLDLEPGSMASTAAAPAAGGPRTVGVMKHAAKAFEGYTLFAPKHNTVTYLIDNQGRVVNSWKSAYEPGQSVYLLPNGHLLHCCFTKGRGFTRGGEGGRLEEFDWDGNLVWEFTYSTDTYMSHHDVEPMPNGNILLVAVEKKSREDAIAAGFDPQKLRDRELYPDYVVEIEKVGRNDARVVWEWHVWDHLVQDNDRSKPNYGRAADFPGRIDVDGSGERIPAFWNHVNSIDYNADLDQILLSVRGSSEIWVIDHSTTTKEAKGNSGGRQGKGGELVYRWGNPAAYGMGTRRDQTLFQQHDARWIDDGSPGAGHILIFNNGLRRPGGEISTVDEIVPPVSKSGRYTRAAGAAYGPKKLAWTYAGEDAKDLYSEAISGAQRLPNGNTLICYGVLGIFREVTPNGETVWEYVNPVVRQGPLAQGMRAGLDHRGHKWNAVFKIDRYAPDHPALRGRKLQPKDVLERPAGTVVAQPEEDERERRRGGDGDRRGGGRRGERGGRDGERGGDRRDDRRGGGRDRERGRGRERMDPAEAARAWAEQARAVAKDLALSAEDTEKLVKAYVDVRREHLATLERLRPLLRGGNDRGPRREDGEQRRGGRRGGRDEEEGDERRPRRDGGDERRGGGRREGRNGERDRGGDDASRQLRREVEALADALARAKLELALRVFLSDAHVERAMKALGTFRERREPRNEGREDRGRERGGRRGR